MKITVLVFLAAMLLVIKPTLSDPCGSGGTCLPSSVCSSRSGAFLPVFRCGSGLGCCFNYRETVCGNDITGRGVCRNSAPRAASSCGGRFIGRQNCPGPDFVQCCVTTCSSGGVNGFCEPVAACSGHGGRSVQGTNCDASGLQCCLLSDGSPPSGGERCTSFLGDPGVCEDSFSCFARGGVPSISESCVGGFNTCCT